MKLLQLITPPPALVNFAEKKGCQVGILIEFAICSALRGVALCCCVMWISRTVGAQSQFLSLRSAFRWTHSPSAIGSS